MQAKIDCAEIDSAIHGIEPYWYSYSVAFGERAANNDLSDPWRLLQAVFGFHLRPENATEPFGPIAIFCGQRSAIPADLDESGLATLRSVLSGSKNSEIRARVADVLWVVTRDRRSAEKAIEA